MARIVIAGALDFSTPNTLDFVRQLGEELVGQGHILMTGCSNEFDTLVARSAYEFLKAKGRNPDECITSYVIMNDEPAHEYGTILRSRLGDWSLGNKRLYVPEPIYKADVVIIIGGKEGTACATNWARIANKPLLPLTAFGGAGRDAYNEELRKFQDKYADRVEQSQYELLNQLPLNPGQLAKDVISLAGRITTSKHVFVVMSVSPDPKLQDAHESFQEVCKEFQYVCHRVDEANTIERIVPEIFTNIKKSAFLIVDLSVERPNVYYELGFAQGLKKPVVITAYKGTVLPFDVNDIPTIFWESQKQLKEKLREKIKIIAAPQGR